MNKLLTLIILILLFISCVDIEKSKSESYVEYKTSFFDLRNSDWTENKWIRKTENLKTIHESFKNFGYDKLEKLIFKRDNEFVIQEIYIKKNFENIMDSLQLTYNKPEKQTKYYAEFWNRRKTEKNDSIVFEIIREFNSMKAEKRQLNYENKFVNDTLVDLLKIEFNNENLNLEKAKSDFNVLKKYRLHQSAYNLLYERPEYFEIDLDRKKLEKELTKTKEFEEAWLIDNAK